MSKINYNKYKVSIIIPVYNAELYLKECITSILQQKHSNLEIIFVDDGSIDNSSEIIDKQCNLDKRFKSIKILNHGPAYARNIGLDHAKGDFILFLDNDDILAPNAISKLCRKAIQYKSEVVIGNTLCFNTKTYYLYRNRNINKGGTKTGLDYFNHALNTNTYTVMLYNYLYKRSFIEKHKLRFDCNIIHEDELWTPNMLILANKVISTDIIHYYYRQRNDSLSKTISKKQWNNELIYISIKLLNIVEKNKCHKLHNIILKRLNQIKTYINTQLHNKN